MLFPVKIYRNYVLQFVHEFIFKEKTKKRVIFDRECPSYDDLQPDIAIMIKEELP